MAHSLSRARQLAVALLVVCGLPSALFAQGLRTGSLSGTITDESSAVVPGVTVTVVDVATNLTRTTVTDDRGGYRFDGLAPSKYTLKAELQGFATVVRPTVTVNVGDALDIDMTLKLSSVAETVTVNGEAPIVQAEKADLSTVINREQIDTLPVNGRNYIDFTLLTPTATPNVSTVRQGVFVDVGSARSYETSLLVDGFWNTDDLFGAPRHIYSPDAVQEFQVVSSGGTAEFGRAIGGVVSAVTKSGGNTLGGTAFGYFRNTSLNSETVIERQQGLPKAAFTRQQYGATIGGALVPNRTFFFGSIENSNENTPVNNLVTAANAAIIGLPAEDVGTINNFRKVLFWMGKVDHALTNDQKLQATVVHTHNNNFGQRSETFATRSRQTHQDLHDTSYQVGWQNVSKNWLHDVRASYFPRFNQTIGFPDGGPPLVADGQLDQLHTPRVTITNVANFGASNINNKQYTDPVQVVYSSSVYVNHHSIKFGADVMNVQFDYFLYTPQVGAYTFQNLTNFLAGRYATYTQTFGDPEVKRHHGYWAGYVQDSWTAHDRLTVNYGLRYDLEVQPSYKGTSFGRDYNNFGPRVAISYDLTGKRKTYLKGSSGIYYDRLFLNFSTTPFYNLLSSPQVFSATWTPATPGAPLYPTMFTGQPANIPASIRDVWLMPQNLRIPRSVQVVGTLEQEVASNWAVTATILYNQTHDEPYTFDTNLAFDDGAQRWIRPSPNYRAINQYQFIGHAQYTGLVLEARKRMSQRFSLIGNVTLARSDDTATGFTDAASDQRFFDREWGPSADIPRVRGVLSWIVRISDALTFAGIYSGRSGLAYDPRVGSAIDTNGDGRFNDRAPGFTRDSFRTAPNHSLDMRLSWSIKFAERRRAQVLLEAFNVFNRDNVTQVSNVYGPTPGQPLALFGQATAYGPPRQMQLGFRLTY